MRSVVKTTQTDAVGINTRVGMLDWTSVSTHLDDHGWAMVEQLLTADECETIAGLYDDEGRFRSHVVMARHGFGRGEYKYFTYPLPDIVADLRRAIYPNLAPIANRWNESNRSAPDSEDRKSTRLNSSHSQISYAVFCLKKKTEERGLYPRMRFRDVLVFVAEAKDVPLRSAPVKGVVLVDRLALYDSRRRNGSHYSRAW